MLNRKQLIQYWKKWMNRRNTFSKLELEELGSHLWEEMDEIVASEDVLWVPKVKRLL